MTKQMTLTEDDHLMGYKRDDELLVELGGIVPSGSLVVIEDEGKSYLCRYENIDGKKFLWPPRGFDPSEYDRLIVGRAVELKRKL